MILRGVSHIHSTYSYDGKLTLPEIKGLFKGQGLSFVCMTEHTDKMTKELAEKFVRECDLLSDGEFVFVPGFEVSYRGSHILMIGAREFIVSYADERTLPLWREKAEFSVFAHPHRNDFAVDKCIRATIDAVEVWNAQYDGKYVPRFRAVRLLQELKKNMKLKAFGGLDFHRVEHFGGPEIIIESDECTEADIINNIREGAYTIKKNDVTMGSDGNVDSVSVMMHLKSMSTIMFIGFSKWVGKMLARHGLSLPKNIKKKIRSRI